MDLMESQSWQDSIPDSLMGKADYFEYARNAMPVLVRQAKAGQELYYSDLAEEIGMLNPRNLNYVLGAIGAVVARRAEENPEKNIPALTCIVLRKGDHLPGDGIDWVYPKEKFRTLSLSQKKARLKVILDEVFAFEEWDWVLAQSGLAPMSPPNIEPSPTPSNLRGESEEHKRFKEFIAENPKLIGLPKSAKPTIEFGFPSNDQIDVLFEYRGEMIGVEVKSQRSPLNDLKRGLYQCVKYKALLDAHQKERGIALNNRVVLALEGEFSSQLIPLKNTFGIDVKSDLRANYP